MTCRSVLDRAKIEYDTIIERPGSWDTKFAASPEGVSGAVQSIGQAQHELPLLSWEREDGHLRLVDRDEYQSLQGAELGGVRPPDRGDHGGRAANELDRAGRSGSLPPPGAKTLRQRLREAQPQPEPEPAPRVGQDAGPSGPAPSCNVDGQRVELAGIQTHPLHPSSLVRLTKEEAEWQGRGLRGPPGAGPAQGAESEVRGRVNGRGIDPRIWQDPKEAARSVRPGPREQSLPTGCLTWTRTMGVG